MARGIIGLNEWERKKPQEMVINITINTDTRQAASEDNVTYSVDYRTVAKKVQKHAENAKRLTVEALAEDIARICLAEPNAKR